MPMIRLPVVIAAGLAVCLAGSIRAGESRRGDLWLVSTRRAPPCRPDRGEERLQYWHLGAEKRWVPAELSGLLAADDPAVPTCVFVHGNRADCRQAVHMGWGLYQCLAREASRPFRFVIWSWPADRVRGTNFRDLRVKACRSDVESWYLARWLRGIDRDVPVSLIGYSFGARVITGALQLLAGGEVAGRRLPERRAWAVRAPVRAVLVAGALDNTWLLPGRRNGLVLSQLQRVLVTRNARDPALRWYHAMYGLHGPDPIGYTGPVGSSRLGTQRRRIELLCLDRSVGRNHGWEAYVRVPCLRSRLAWYAFLDSSPPPSEPKRFVPCGDTRAIESRSEAAHEP
jgi:hypothetical protein